MRLLTVMMICGATAALAVPVGGKLFIIAKDTEVQKQASEKGTPVMKLQPGAEVIWLGADAKNPLWHAIEANGKKGFVRRSDCSPNRPQAEISAPGKPMSAEAFASSGAATKGPFGLPRARKYSGAAQANAAAELIYVEELNRAKATPAAVAAKNKELNR